LDEDEELFNKTYIMTCPNFYQRQAMKKTVLHILYLIVGVILMYIAFIPRVLLSKLNTPIWVKELSTSSLFGHMFFYMFLSVISFYIGLSLILNKKIEKILSINRIICIAIIVFLLVGTLMPAYISFYV